MENAELAAALEHVADVLELKGGNAFKVRAYRQASQVLSTLATPAAQLWREGRLTELPGIGSHVAAHVGELLETGRCRQHDELIASVPPGLVEMMRLEGVGPRTTEAVWKALGVVDVDGLERAAWDGTLLEVPRVGKKRAEAILAAITRHRARAGRTPLFTALPHARAIVGRLLEVPGVTAADSCGSLRRHAETVGDIDVLAAAADPGPVAQAFLALPGATTVLAEGTTRCAIRLTNGLQVDLRVVAPDEYGAALHYFTGSKAHNIAVRTRAVRRGLKLSEYGIFDRHGKRLGGATEDEVFRAVGLPWIPPELREGAGEIEAAEHGELPVLVEEADLLGDLHVHSRASADARGTLEELHAQALRLGRRYLAITDHSRARPLGLDAERTRAHAAAVRAFNDQHLGPPVLLAGVEVDILKDGALDLPGDVLRGLDCVVASIHSHFTLPRAEMTARVVRALRSGVVHVLGHPSARQLGARDPVDFDVDEVLKVAREMRVALEVNAMPERLDLSDRNCRLARGAGVRVAISSDAHAPQHLGQLRNGLWVARRGWLEKEDVVTALPLEQLRRWLVRDRAA